MLRNFYCITRGFKDGGFYNSLYQIIANSDATSLEVLRLTVTDNQVHVSEKLKTKGVVGVSYRHGLVGYKRVTTKRPDNPSSDFIAGKSSPFVALLESRRDAKHCYLSDELYHWDNEYLESTMNVLKMIGAKRQLPIILDTTLARAVKAEEKNKSKTSPLQALLMSEHMMLNAQ